MATKYRFSENDIDWNDLVSLKKSCKTVATKISKAQTYAKAFVEGPFIQSSEAEALSRREEMMYLMGLLDDILAKIVFLDDSQDKECKEKGEKYQKIYVEVLAALNKFVKDNVPTTRAVTVPGAAGPSMAREQSASTEKAPNKQLKPRSLSKEDSPTRLGMWIRDFETYVKWYLQ